MSTVISFSTALNKHKAQQSEKLQAILSKQFPEEIFVDEFDKLDPAFAAEWQPFFDAFGLGIDVQSLDADMFEAFLRDLSVMAYLAEDSKDVAHPSSELLRYFQAVVTGNPCSVTLPENLRKLKSELAAKEKAANPEKGLRLVKAY